MLLYLELWSNVPAVFLCPLFTQLMVIWEVSEISYIYTHRHHLSFPQTDNLIVLCEKLDMFMQQC